MKKPIILYIFLALLFASSCNKDLGNYNYTDLDSLYLTEFQDTVNVFLGETLKIEPNIQTKLQEIKEDDLEFQWDAFDQRILNSAERRRILSNNRSLDIVPPFLVGSYTAYLRITQKSTGRRWTYPFVINIEGSFGKHGWFILSDKGNKSHLDYFQDDPENWNTYPKIYRDINLLWNNKVDDKQLILEGAPVNLDIFSNADPATPAYKNYLYINTQDNTYKINLTDGFLYNSLAFSLKNETALGTPSSAEIFYPASAGMISVIKDNNIYSFYLQMNKYYNVPVNNNPDGTYYKVSKYVANPANNYFMNLLLFDMDGKRFMRMDYFASSAVPVTVKNDDIDLANTGMDLVWMDQTQAFSGQAVAIMKKNDNYFLLRIKYNNGGSASIVSLEDVTTRLTDLKTTEHFAIDNKYGYLFYVSNNKLYQYDMDAKQLKTARTFDGKKVSMLKVERLVTQYPGSPPFNMNLARMEPVGYSLLVATYDPANPNTSGRIDFLMVNPLMGDLTPSIKPFEGFGIVKDAQYTDFFR